MVRIYHFLQVLSHPAVFRAGMLLLGITFTGASLHASGVIWGA